MWAFIFTLEIWEMQGVFQKGRQWFILLYVAEICINIRGLGGILKGSMSVCVKPKWLPPNVFNIYNCRKQSHRIITAGSQGCVCNGTFYNILFAAGKNNKHPHCPATRNGLNEVAVIKGKKNVTQVPP